MSLRKIGQRHPTFLGAIGLELVGLPVLARWQG